MSRLGIGVLCYFGLPDLIRCVEAIRRYTCVPHELVVQDNSDDQENVQWLEEHAPEARIVDNPRNVGCSVARNRFVHAFLDLGVEHFIVMDQDVEPVRRGWAADMLTFMDRHPSAGCAAWPLSNLSHHPVYQDGEVCEVPGLCNIYRLQAAVLQPWEERMFMYRFDTLHCILMRELHGFTTHIIEGLPAAVKHNHGGQGVNRNPFWKEHQEHSAGVYQEVLQRHGITDPLAHDGRLEARELCLL